MEYVKMNDLRFSLISEADLDDRQDRSDSEAATAGSVWLDDPEGHPRAHDHHEKRSVDLKVIDGLGSLNKDSQECTASYWANFSQ